MAMGGGQAPLAPSLNPPLYTPIITSILYYIIMFKLMFNFYVFLGISAIVVDYYISIDNNYFK